METNRQFYIQLLSFKDKFLPIPVQQESEWAPDEDAHPDELSEILDILTIRTDYTGKKFKETAFKFSVFCRETIFYILRSYQFRYIKHESLIQMVEWTRIPETGRRVSLPEPEADHSPANVDVNNVLTRTYSWQFI
jgi:hypothetical protein